MNNISKEISDIALSKIIANKVSEYGGKAYYVGGYVRDRLLNLDNKDIDIEVHGISPKDLESILDNVGKRIEIGESFGIYSLKGHNIDIAMPRKEISKGLGHKDFDIIVDPYIGTYKAAKRRDFTINSIYEDILSNEIIDHFNGVDDLNNKIIRYVNEESFKEDPLRVLRACQFASRFNFKISKETKEICKKIDISKLSKERIEGELKKALLKANKPSIFFKNLRYMNQLDYWFKELKDLIGVNQNPKYHAEGDVWNHTMLVLDEGAKLKDEAKEPYMFMLSCLVHDFGKSVSTKVINGIIRSIGHEYEGIQLTKNFIKRITNENKVLGYTTNMTKLHMKPLVLINASSSIKAFNKMFDESIEPHDLIYLSICDNLGRKKDGEYVPTKDILFKHFDIYLEYMSRPYVTGKDLIELGIEPNKNFKEALDFAHKLRLVGVNKEQTLKETISYYKKLEK